jgi:3-oxoadipate enol-lactonase
VVARRLAMDLPFPDIHLEYSVVDGIGGTPLRCYASGPADAPPVLLVAPCGMPVELVAAWITALSTEHRVLTWETSGLFGDEAERARLNQAYLAGTPRDRVDAQTRDLITVLESDKARDAHVVGLCGGAVLALSAAAQRPDLVRSLSLWHGDLLVRTPGCRTAHQANLSAVLEMAGRDVATAASVHDVLLRSMLDSVPPDLAHLVLHPYATAGLLHRYGRINGAIMALDASELVDGVSQPVLVVTSTDDETAHPEASRAVAGALADARLVVREHGDHITLFRGSPSLFELATEFIRRHC